MEVKYVYDVAFSFLHQDEVLALNLYNLLKDSLNCFIYTEQQKKLAGTNGETTFNKVFSVESRIVVILYRKEWGTSNWTRIEETAIKNRGFSYGYDFVILIPVEEKMEAPIWLPRNRLWIGLERWGIESAASVIEARVQEYGGEPKVITLSDKILTEENKRKKQMDIDKFIGSSEGRTAEFLERGILIDLIKKDVHEINEKTPEWHFYLTENEHEGVDLFSYGYQLTIHYYRRSPEPYLFVTLTKGYSTGQITPINNERYKLDINLFDEYGWSIKDKRKGFKTTQQLVDFWLNELYKKVNKNNRTRD